MTTMTMTAAKARRTGEDLGLTGEALEVYIRAGACARHEGRVALARSTALAQVAPEAHGETRPTYQLAASFLLWLDAAGQGGPGDRGGRDGSTTRARWASGLGKGRRHASDGPAWSAAESCASARLLDAARAAGWVAIEVTTDPAPPWAGGAYAQAIPLIAEDDPIVLRQIQSAVRRMCWTVGGGDPTPDIPEYPLIVPAPVMGRILAGGTEIEGLYLAPRCVEVPM